MKKITFLLCVISVLFVSNTFIIYGTGFGCNVNPYNNLSSGNMEYWDDIENLSPIICNAFVGNLTYVVEYTVFPGANTWTQIPLSNPAALCDNLGDLNFTTDLKALGNRLCNQTLVFLITPYCANGENGTPLVLSIVVECGQNTEREGTNIRVRVEDLITGAGHGNSGNIFGTPCATDDIPCIKANIHTTVNPYAIPVEMMAGLTSKRGETGVNSQAIAIHTFPNPTQNYVYFELGSQAFFEEGTNLVIMDAYGRTVHSLHLNDDLQKRLLVDLSDLPSGIYYLKLRIFQSV